ncbi:MULTISPECIES: DNA double-strand break repair nuclease NurA [unclassified Campylobacter]|uniref:DNA double-strand break repair nuclease NurA n=1 Tax=unclassified Campylobacter TaxID=2593542 RepID=UPI00147316F0|nr:MULTISPECIES: DNA double-strand break repair nuclease NurA [unclassified Campylobacter]
MPFSGEFASKISHFDIMKNPDIIEFLQSCPDVPRPSVENIKDLIENEYYTSYFQTYKNAKMPKFVLSLDGSCYEVLADKDFPSRKLGYIKIGLVFLDVQRYDSIASNDKYRYIDPKQVAKLQDDISCLSFALPGAYVQEKGDASAFESFRKRLLKIFKSEQYKLGDYRLIDSLFELSLRIEKAEFKNGRKFFKLDKCPNRNCGKNDKFEIEINDEYVICPYCKNKIFATDVLRVHEPFTNTGENQGTYSRVMNLLEHLVLFHYLNYIYNNDIKFLSELAVILDGPLAIYGEGAKYHRALMMAYYEMQRKCVDSGYSEPIIIGLVKTGRIVEHFLNIKNRLAQNVIFPIDDMYRYEFINEKDDSQDKHFGVETYYGQDFFIKSSDHRQFVVCVLYPFSNKTEDFHNEKTKISHYKNFDSILATIIKFETDMYQNGSIPVILAHKHSSISLKPGGKMLDILSRKYFK